ncbi:MAG: precorrin-8X methylmutase [Thiohalomonadales bacterium]
MSKNRSTRQIVGMYDYIKDPQAITVESFRQIEALADLSQLDQRLHPIALRLIHTCGQVNIIEHLKVHGDVMVNGIAALRDSASVLCDVEMVRQGLSKGFLKSEPQCFLNHKDVAAQAKEQGITRSMQALTHWRDTMKGAVIVIGNAPTALFRYLEMLEQGADKPALIIAMPVGFVGAAESKQALYEYACRNNIAAITLFGRVGGSALAAAAFNAIAGSLHSVSSYDGR